MSWLAHCHPLLYVMRLASGIISPQSAPDADQAVARDHGGHLSQAEAVKLLLSAGGSHAERSASVWKEWGVLF